MGLPWRKRIAHGSCCIVTSHSSQGVTADRVLVHVDTEQAHDQLVNSRLAYVSVSRGRFDAQIYTNILRVTPSSNCGKKKL
jgi:ATP-dependent exoDNAse (exonuclease V) alpha subunit